MLLYPGRHVWIELPLPRVENASPAQVVVVGWPNSYLKGMGMMSGWWPNALIGRTRAEAEWKAAKADELRFSRRSRC
jgi:hypothetical protein